METWSRASLWEVSCIRVEFVFYNSLSLFGSSVLYTENPKLNSGYDYLHSGLICYMTDPERFTLLILKLHLAQLPTTLVGHVISINIYRPKARMWSNYLQWTQLAFLSGLPLGYFGSAFLLCPCGFPKMSLWPSVISMVSESPSPLRSPLTTTFSYPFPHACQRWLSSTFLTRSPLCVAKK